MEKPVGIIGLGALGSVFAALLAPAGVPVVAASRSQSHREAIASRGLVLREGDSEARVPFPVAAELPREQQYALVMITVKSFDTETAAQTLAPWLGKQTPVLTLQNGLGNAET